MRFHGQGWRGRQAGKWDNAGGAGARSKAEGSARAGATSANGEMWGGRNRALGTAVFVLLATAGPALAILPPQFYQQARENAPNVLVLQVKHVGDPPEPQGVGTCAVSGTVVKVERGTAYRAGQAVTVRVHCMRPGGKPLIGPFFYRPVAELRAAPYGRAFLDAEGKVVLSQYDMLQNAP